MYSTYLKEQDICSTRELMSRHFSSYYDKIKNRLSSYYCMPIDYSSKLQFPGFHIMYGLSDTICKSSRFRFHIDAGGNLPRFGIPIGTIDSIIIPIMLPSSGGGLLWSDDIYRRNKINEIAPLRDCDHLFVYTEGTMALWPGDLPHAIAPFTLMNLSEYRLTFQFHVNRLPDHGIIFW
jgi:hypothetical protein